MHSVSAVATEENINNDEEKSEVQMDTIKNDIETTNVATTLDEVASPSAPAIEDMPEVDQPLEKLLYPNLKNAQLNNVTVHSALKSNERLILQPFSKSQLIELYSNPELYLAEAFEADFINTELNNTYKDHPLHELIKKYSHSRYNLKVNMLDLHGYIKCFQENAHQVWIIENRITTYEGVCADAERVRKNELYE